jgi:hypothetical protein
VVPLFKGIPFPTFEAIYAYLLCAMSYSSWNMVKSSTFIFLFFVFFFFFVPRALIIFPERLLLRSETSIFLCLVMIGVMWSGIFQFILGVLKSVIYPSAMSTG